jgi:Mg-chelatase subunit ChlD
MISAFNRLASELKNYLSPTTKTAPAMIGEKVQFADVQRRLTIYLRALWECEFAIKQAEIDDLGNWVGRPFIEYSVINLPQSYYDFALDGIQHVTGMEIYRAAAAHAAAHLMHRKIQLSEHSLNKWQIATISVIEDARVETLSIRRFPGLKHLWAAQHIANPQDNKTAGDYLNRLARSLLDEGFQDDDLWVKQGRELFNSAEDLTVEQISRSIGLILADTFLEKQIQFDVQSYKQSALYHDDNRYLWKSQKAPLEIINPYLRSHAAVGIEESEKYTKERPNQKLELAKGLKSVSETYFYPEWNYRTRTEDQSWVTLREKLPVPGDIKIAEKIIAENKHLIARMKTLLRAIRDGAPYRIRKLEEGDELDINAAIRARVNIRLGEQPDSRVMIRSVQKTRDISVLLLLDISRSMNNKIREHEHTALELAQQSSILFAEAISSVGDPFAIHGFCSDSRHFVEYFCLKDFDQPYDDVSKTRISGIAGHHGTRMGAAIRHATHYLNNQNSGKKLLLMITDGEPADTDTTDRTYLRNDAKKSVEDARRNGIQTYCISLDREADRYVSRIFGAKNYQVVDHVKCLPEKVLLIYAGLAR